jgi:hypothetical protein
VQSIALQAPGFNILNTLLAHGPAAAATSLASDAALTERCLALLDDRRALIAAKALLALALLVPNSHASLLLACQQNLLTRFVRVGTEGGSSTAEGVKEYAQQCQAALRAAVLAEVPRIMEAVRASSF